jgi:hypothetical protein
MTVRARHDIDHARCLRRFEERRQRAVFKFRQKGIDEHDRVIDFHDERVLPKPPEC